MTEQEIRGLQPGDVVVWYHIMFGADKYIHVYMMYKYRMGVEKEPFSHGTWHFDTLIDISTGIRFEAGHNELLSYKDLREGCTLIDQEVSAPSTV